MTEAARIGALAIPHGSCGDSRAFAARSACTDGFCHVVARDRHDVSRTALLWPGTDRTCDLGTEHAVEKHIRSIFQKLHIDSGPDDHRRVLTVLAFLRSS